MEIFPEGNFGVQGCQGRGYQGTQGHIGFGYSAPKIYSTKKLLRECMKK